MNWKPAATFCAIHSMKRPAGNQLQPSAQAVPWSHQPHRDDVPLVTPTGTRAPGAASWKPAATFCAIHSMKRPAGNQLQPSASAVPWSHQPHRDDVPLVTPTGTRVPGAASWKPAATFSAIHTMWSSAVIPNGDLSSRGGQLETSCNLCVIHILFLSSCVRMCASMRPPLPWHTSNHQRHQSVA